MSESILAILNPTEDQQRAIEELLDYLIRNQFMELFLPDVQNDKKLSDKGKQELEWLFQIDHDHVVLGNMTFRRRGMRWNYEIHSVGSLLIMAEEVLFWLKEEYPCGSTVDIFDRGFLSRLLEVYQAVLEDRLSEEAGIKTEELESIRLMPDKRFFEFMEDQLVSDGYDSLQIDRETIARMIRIIEKYEMMLALEDAD